jgi:hypothetical protein
MADYTKSPVFSSPAYWIALGVGVVGIGAAAMQERTGSGSAARVHRGSGVAYNVYLRGKLIDTVFQSGMSTVEEVKRSLIDHDGYDAAIRVTKAARSSGSGSMARITSVPKLIEALNARGFSFGKPNKTGSGTIQVGESKPYGAFFTVSHGRAFFHLLNNPVSIANVDDIINAIEANKRNSAELYKTGKISGSMADMHGSGGIGAAAMQERRGGSMSRNVEWKMIGYELSIERNKHGDPVMGPGGRPKKTVTGEYALGSAYLPENPTQKEIVSKLGAYGVPDLMVITSKTGGVIEVGHKDMPGARLLKPFVRLERQYSPPTRRH